jgi:Lrp/AsnC family transcriptional regulator, leucine-responsive regulatory protein
MRHLEQVTGRIAGLGAVTTTVVYSSVLKNRAITAATFTSDKNDLT